VKVQEALEIIDYRISSGAKFCWSCFGKNCYILDFQDYSEFDVQIYFDTDSREVYLIELFDHTTEHYNFWLNPKFANSYEQECIRRNVERCPDNYQQIPFIYSNDVLNQLRHQMINIMLDEIVEDIV